MIRRAPARRRAWYRDLMETQIQRDVRDVTRIHSFEALPRLLTLAAANTARLINVSDLAAPFQIRSRRQP
jgi:predicted AAA+ superfamily ATPase